MSFGFLRGALRCVSSLDSTDALSVRRFNTPPIRNMAGTIRPPDLSNVAEAMLIVERQSMTPTKSGLSCISPGLQHALAQSLWCGRTAFHEWGMARTISIPPTPMYGSLFRTISLLCTSLLQTKRVSIERFS